MGDSASAGAGAGEAERARKIYRYVSDTARRIDDASPACKSTSDLFTTYLEGLRQKLRDNCEKLMFLDPLAYGRKSLELLWRKAYYETVSIAKKVRNKDDDYDNYISTHIVCGIGHYHHIISRIKTEFNVQYTSSDYPPMMWDDDSKHTNLEIDEDVKHWGLGIIHSCLIYLGDLSRYQSEMFDFDASIAARYYLQAAYIDLSSGMPYNQLGNLYTDKNHNLDSVCYYVHCMSCAVPFEGADGNLSRLFEKNAQYVDSVVMDDLESLTQTERVKLTIARVLTLTEHWYVGKENVDVAQMCSLTVQDLKDCLSYEKPLLPDINKNYEDFIQRKEEETSHPSYLNNDIIYKVVQLCLFCINKMDDIDTHKAFAVKAFTLALFSQLLQKLLNELLKCGFLNPSRTPRQSANRKHYDSIDEEVAVHVEPQENGVEIEIPTEQAKETEVVDVNKNGHAKEVDESVTVNVNGKSNGKKMSAKRRRRRRLNSCESSEESDDETDSSSLETEGSDSDGEGSTHSEDSILSEDSNDEHNSKGDNNPEKHTKAIKQEKIPENHNSTSLKKPFQDGKIDEIQVQNFLRGDNFLPSLKLLQDWVLTETDLILSCGESGEALFQSVVDLVNILRINFTNKGSTKNRLTCKILNFARNTASKWDLEFKVIPLPEDVNLRGTDICKFDKDAAEWDLLKKYDPSVYEENVIRILSFINFGEQIANIVPRIRYNRTMQIFFIKKKPIIKVGRKDVKKKVQRSPPKPHPGRHTHPGDTSLMRNLGKLWLQSQVRELESAVRAGGGGREALPAYLVVDTDALTHHTPLVKQLVRARRFVVLVPTVVLQSIDDLKKEQGGARDAIRWLESQLQSGSRFLRTQRPSETRPLPLVRYPRKAPKHVHQFVQIIEFCHHFVAADNESGGNGDSGQTKPMLILLTGTKLSDMSEEQKDFSFTGVAQSAGVPVDCIVHFFSKWRHLLNKTGKKR